MDIQWGGLVAYDYLTNPDYIQRNVENFVSIGTPFDGANLARLADFAGDYRTNPIKDAFDTTSPAYDYLSNKNGYLDELQSRESPLGVNLSTISYYQNFDPSSGGHKGSDGVVSYDSATHLKNAQHFSYYMEGDFFFNIPTPFAHIGMPRDFRIIELIELKIFD